MPWNSNPNYIITTCSNQESLLDPEVIALSKSMEIGIRLYELHLGFTVCTG